MLDSDRLLRRPEVSLLDALLNVLFPNPCVVCNRNITERKWGAACQECWSALEPIPAPFCPQCGTPATAIEGPCDECRRGDHAFDFARSVFLFNDRMREIIHHLKYSGRVSLARPLSRILLRCLQTNEFCAEAVVPVPLHRSRIRERGFNQAELLAKELGLPLRSGVLRRRKNTPPQTGMTRPQRVSNLAGAFEVKGRISGCVLVVDDVYTTGSTMHEIAKTLKRANVSRVEVLTVARVPRLG